MIINLIADIIVPATLLLLTAVFFFQRYKQETLHPALQVSIILVLYAMVVVPVWNVHGPITDARTTGPQAPKETRADDIRIALRSIHIDPEKIDGVSIGGDRETDWLFVSDVSPGLIQFRRVNNAPIPDNQTDGDSGIDSGQAAPQTSAQTVTPVEILVRQARTGPGSVVSYESPKGSGADRAFVGEREITPGEKLCVTCESREAAKAQCNITMPGTDISASAMMLNNEPQSEIITRKFMGVPARNYDPSTRIYSLRTFGRPLSGDNPAPACEDFVNSDNKSGLPSGFIYRKKGEGSSFFGNLLPGNSTPDSITIPKKLLPGGPELRLRLYRVRYADPGREPEAQELIERLSERREVVVSLDVNGVLNVRLKTPEITQIKAENIANTIALELDNKISFKPLSLTFDSVPGRDNNIDYSDAIIRFRALGRPLARATTGQIKLPIQAGSRIDLDDKIVLPYNSKIQSTRNQAAGGSVNVAAVRWGEYFNLGRDVRVEVSLDRLDRFAGLPFHLYALVLGAVFLNMFVLLQYVAKSNPLLWSVTIVAQTLLSLRILVGLSGSYVDPDATNAAANTIMFMAVTPALFCVLAGHYLGLWRTCLAAGFIVVTFLSLNRAGEIDAIALLITGGSLLLLGLCLIVPKLISIGTLPPSFSGKMILEGLDKQLTTLRLSSGPKPKKPFSRRRIGTGSIKALLIHPLFLIGAAAILLRILLAFFGQREAITFFGPRISNSIWYIPTIILLLACLWSRYYQRAAAHKDLSLMIGFGVCLVVLFLVPAVLLRDVGIIIFCLGSLLCIFRETLRGADYKGWAAMALYGVLALVFFYCCRVYIEDTTQSWLIIIALLSACILICLFFIDSKQRLRTFVALILVLAIVVCVMRFDLSIPKILIALFLALPAVLIFGKISPTKLPIWGDAMVAARPTIMFTILATLLIAFNIPTVNLPSNAAPNMSAELENTEAALQRQMNRNQNELRLLFILDPNASGDYGTRESERLSAALAHFSDYSDCPKNGIWVCRISGRGFLNIPKPTELFAVHMDDNVSAIYLTAQFGRLAAAALIVMLFMFAALYSRLPVPGPGEETSVHAKKQTALIINGRFLAWTVAMIAAYMVLANYRIVPFTGQNIFFLAAKSGSDALFSFTVFALMVIALKRKADG